MPVLNRVIDNTLHGDGTIESKVRVSAINETRAKRQATRVAVRHNGYSDLVVSSDNTNISVDDVKVDYEGKLGLTYTYIVDVIITGAGEFL